MTRTTRLVVSLAAALLVGCATLAIAGGPDQITDVLRQLGLTQMARSLGSSGVESLGGLTGATDGQVATWDSATSRWVPEAAAGGLDGFTSSADGTTSTLSPASPQSRIKLAGATGSATMTFASDDIVIGSGTYGSLGWVSGSYIDDDAGAMTVSATLLTLADGPTVHSGAIKGTTGDPASPAEGQLQINTFDNAIKIYADGGWRTIATW